MATTTQDDQKLYSVYIEAQHGGNEVIRTQWIVFPPFRRRIIADLSTGIPAFESGNVRAIRRTLSDNGGRPKWETLGFSSCASAVTHLGSEFDRFTNRGWHFSDPTIIPLELSDYLSVWSNADRVSTPYKALRHFDRALHRQRRKTVTGKVY